MLCPICKRHKGFRCMSRNVWQRIVFILSNPRISWWILAKILPSQHRAAPRQSIVRPKYSILQVISNKILNHCIHYDEGLAYKKWQKDYESIPYLATNKPSVCPTFLFVINQSKLSANGLSQFISSVEQQTWQHRAIRILPQDLAVEVCLQDIIHTTKYDYICLIESDLMLASRALEWIVQYWPSTQPDVLYGDHDLITQQGIRHTPSLKPQWDSVLQQNTNYMAPLVICNKQIFCNPQIKTQNSNYELLTLLTNNIKITHVPRILCHVSDSILPECPINMDDIKIVTIPNTAYWHIHPHSESLGDKISIIIPTKDAVDLLRCCIKSIIEKNKTANFEIIIINNKSQNKETLQYLTQICLQYTFIRVINYDLPFNYSDMNNCAAQHATGNILCFVNNDIELRSENVLLQMLEYVQQTWVGAVGIKLYYPNNTIQHAGVCLGLGGIAGHLLRGLPKDDVRFALYTHVPRQVSAVTAAFLMLRRELFDTVVGFDAQNLAVAYNDVDLCLKVKALGFKNILLPHLEAVHFESASRPSDFSSQQSKRYIAEGSFFQQKWQAEIDNEAFYNQNLGKEREDMRIVC